MGPCNETFDLVCEKFPSLRYYYQTEEPGMGFYETNDSEGKYFTDKYIVDLCTAKGKYFCEYFADRRACLRGLARSQEKPSARNRMPRLCLKNGRRKTPILAAVSMNMWSWIKSDRQP